MPAPALSVFFDRTIGGANRRVLALPGVRTCAALLRHLAQARYSKAAAPLPVHLEEAVHRLEQQGLFVASAPEASALGFLMPSADALFEELERSRAGSTTRRKASDMEDVTPAYLAGLHPTLIALAEAYIGLPVLYLGIEAKVEFPDGRLGGTRNWHWDLEDVRVLKVVVYCSDVGKADGPLEYVPQKESLELRKKSGDRIGIHSEAAIEADRVECLGPAGTVVFFDGAQLLHRVKPPADRLRRSLMYSYVSYKPRQIFAGARPSVNAKRQLRTLLSDAQMKCVP